MGDLYDTDLSPMYEFRVNISKMVAVAKRIKFLFGDLETAKIRHFSPILTQLEKVAKELEDVIAEQYNCIGRIMKLIRELPNSSLKKYDHLVKLEITAATMKESWIALQTKVENLKMTIESDENIFCEPVFPILKEVLAYADKMIELFDKH